MEKEILLYHLVDSWSSEIFIKEMNELEDEETFTLRVNTGGGNPEYGWGIVAKFSEYKGNKKVKVDGKAYSFGTFLLCYTDDTEALDVSEFLIHRAAYGEWYEKSEYFTEAIKGNLERINKSLRAALEAKIDVPKFEKMKGVKMKDIFSMDSRIDVFLNAKEAKSIGLIKKINKITPSKKAQIDAQMMESAEQIAAHYGVVEIQPKIESPSSEENNDNPKEKNKMTLQEFKTKHADVYNEAFNEGVTAEKDRTGAWLTFVDVDPKAVQEGIAKGETLTATATAEFGRKAMSNATLDASEEESEESIKTKEEKKPEAEKEAKIDSFLGDVKQNLKN